MERKTLFFALVFLASVSYAIVAALGSQERRAGEAQDPTLSLDLLPDLIVERAERIEIFEPDVAAQRNGDEGARKTISLQRVAVLNNEDSEGDQQEAAVQWTVSSAHGYPARAEKVTELLETLAGFPGGNVRSRNPDSHQTLQVDASGKEVIIHDEEGDLVAHFFVGRTVTGLKSTFVRKDGSDESVLVPGNIAPKLVTFRNNWLDNQILKFDYKLVAEFTIDSLEHGRIRFEKQVDTGGWKVTEPEEFVAETRSVDSVLRPMAVLRFIEVAGSFDEPKEDHGLTQPRVKMTIRLSDDTTFVFSGGAQKDERTAFATIEGNPFVFEVSRYTIDKLDRDAGNYRPQEKPQPGTVGPEPNPTQVVPATPRKKAPAPNKQSPQPNSAGEKKEGGERR